MVAIQIRDNGTVAALVQLGDRLRDVQAPLQETGAYLERETRFNFAKEQTADGESFAPLAESTQRQKKTSAILRESGSFVGSVGFQMVGDRSVGVGSSVEYDVFHINGTRKMSARNPFGIADRHVPVIEGFFQQHFEGAL